MFARQVAAGLRFCPLQEFFGATAKGAFAAVRMAPTVMGMRSAVMLFVVLLFVGGAPTPTGANDPVALNATAPNRAHLSSPPAAPAPATPVPHSPPYFKIVPAAELGKLGTSGSRQPFFRGGKRSRAGVSSSAAVSPRVATASPRTVLYNGLNKPGENAGLSGNLGGTPPDSTGAIGPSNYVEMVNSSIAVYDRSLNLVTRATFDNFVGQPSGVPLCDPQIEWDPAANRWLFEILYCGGGGQVFVVGWSKTSDPATLSSAGWCEIVVSTGSRLFDYPKLGHNSNYLIVGGNFYNLPSTFVTAGIAWTALPANGDTTCPSNPIITGTTANPLKNGDAVTSAFTPVPVNTITGATDGYVVSAYDPAGNTTNGGNGGPPIPQSKLAVWHLDSAGVLHQDADIAVTTYAMPFSAPQLNGTTHLLDTLDGRLTQAVGDPTTGIWTQHTVNNSLTGRSVVTWYKITASGSATTLADVGTISDPNDWVFNAAISPRFDAQGAAIQYNRSSLTTYPVIAAQIRLASTPAGQMEPGELVLATSSNFDSDFTCNNPNTNFPCRWGDYSAATPDPVQTNVVWGTNEFNTASGSAPAWSDENFALIGPAAPRAPTAVVAAPGDNSATVTWTPSTFDPGIPVTSYKLTAYAGASPVATTTVAAATAATFTALADGVTYTFTVIAIDAVGASPESVHSNPVTPVQAPTAQVTAPTAPPRDPVLPAPAPSPPAR